MFECISIGELYVIPAKAGIQKNNLNIITNNYIVGKITI